MGYKREVSKKIVKVTHTVEFSLGSGISDLLNSLNNVPEGARIIESEGSDISEDRCVILFQTEESGEFYDD